MVDMPHKRFLFSSTALVLTYGHKRCGACVSIIQQVYLEHSAAVVLVVRPQQGLQDNVPRGKPPGMQIADQCLPQHMRCSQYAVATYAEARSCSLPVRSVACNITPNAMAIAASHERAHHVRVANYMEMARQSAGSSCSEDMQTCCRATAKRILLGNMLFAIFAHYVSGWHCVSIWVSIPTGLAPSCSA